MLPTVDHVKAEPVPDFEIVIKSSYFPLEGHDLQDQIGLAETRNEDKIPVMPEQLFGLIDSLYEKPELRPAVTLVELFGLREEKLKAVHVEGAKLKIGNVKCNRSKAKAPMLYCIAYP